MKYKLSSKHILHELGINKTYSGYDYILYGLSLIEEDEYRLTNITKTLYIDIAKEFHTSPICVERNIRKVIEVIWKHAPESENTIHHIFGTKYAQQKPTNKEFLELLYEYMSYYNVFQELIINCDSAKCPFSNHPCHVYCSLIENLSRIK